MKLFCWVHVFNVHVFNVHVFDAKSHGILERDIAT